jgi:hypothetical protein
LSSLSGVYSTLVGHISQDGSASERLLYLDAEDELRGWVGLVRALAEQAEQVHVLMNPGLRRPQARQLAALLAQPRAEHTEPATPFASKQ